MPSPVVDAVMRYRDQLLARDARRAVEMASAYGRIWLDLQRQWADLQRAIEAGENKAYLATRIRDLQAQAEDAIRRYGAYADQQVALGVQDGITSAGSDAARIVQAAYPLGGDWIVQELWNRIPEEAVETMLGMLSSTSPLRTRMEDRLGKAVAEKVGDTLTQGVAQGWNPRKVQSVLRRTLGEGLEWSLSATRTATLWSYREATRAQYAANSDVVKGWVWCAKHDSRTCLSCLAMDGTVHPLSEPLADHHSGRCSAKPQTATYRELGIPIDELPDDRPTGREWFEAQPEGVQREMMGERAWEEWRAGKFGLRDYSKPYQDEVYGEMLRQATLKELLGEAA